MEGRVTKRQPRARTGMGGIAPSTRGRDPRSRVVPTVAEDTVRSQALQRLTQLPSTATSAQILATLNEVISTLQNRERA